MRLPSWTALFLSLTIPATAEQPEPECLTGQRSPVQTCQIALPDRAVAPSLDRRPIRSTPVDARGGWMRDTYDFLSRRDTEQLTSFGQYARR